MEASSRRDALISQNSGLKKEQDEQFVIKNIDFNPNNRVTKIEILGTKKYRTIERYVTRNYVRYPVYSGWKIKERIIKKTLKLTNRQLEELEYYNDELIVSLAKDIISCLPEKLHPKWYNLYYLNKAFEYENNSINKVYLTINKKFDNIHSRFENDKRLLEKVYSKQNSDNADENLREIEEFYKSLPTISKRYRYICDKITKQKKEYVSRIYNQERSKVHVLSDEIELDEFIPLVDLAGYEKEKIIGCYVIRNVELNKYYVGQSKDVLKRVTQQHFKGTEPKNIIFAKDYYNSKINKDRLFEVKIIPLDTKDELDAMEKELIEEYDSFNNGYNGTAGNT